MMFCASENKRVCHSKMTIVISVTLWCEWPPCVVSLVAILSWSSPSWTLIGPRVVLMVTEVESSPNWRWQRAHASLLFSMESLGNNDNTTISELFDKHPAVSSQCAIDPWYLNFIQKRKMLSQENDLTWIKGWRNVATIVALLRFSLVWNWKLNVFHS